MNPAKLLPLLAILAACGAPAEPAKPAGDPFLAIGIDHAAKPPLKDTYCSGQMTEAQFDKLKDAGIQRVVSLRKADEEGTGWEEARAKALGIEFVRIPVDGAAGLTKENIDKLDAALKPEKPTLVACHTSNRVGAMMALRAFGAGTKAEDALALGKQCGLVKLEPTVKEKLGLK